MTLLHNASKPCRKQCCARSATTHFAALTGCRRNRRHRYWAARPHRGSGASNVSTPLVNHTLALLEPVLRKKPRDAGDRIGVHVTDVPPAAGPAIVVISTPG